MMKPQADSLDTMAEIRAAIDVLDDEMIALLADRAELIDQASRVKAKIGLAARLEDRVEEVAMNARKNAQKAGFDPDMAEKLWRQLIDWSIAREEAVLGPDEDKSEEVA